MLHRAVVWLLLASLAISGGVKSPLVIQGFVPRDNPTFVATSLEPAANLAIEDVNNNPNLLANYTLNLTFVDTKCDPAEATWQLIRTVIRREEPGRVVMLLGGGCSPATEPLAALAGLFYNLTQVSYSSTSPSLTDNKKFGRFFRTIPYEVFVSRARYAMMQRFNWQRVALLYETQTIYATTVHEFVNLTGLDDVLVRSFTRDPKIHLQRIKSEDYRIIFAWFYEDKAVDTFCEAIKLGLVTRDHVWVMPAFQEDWWKAVASHSSDCDITEDAVKDALPYAIFVDTYPWYPNASIRSLSGRDRQSFEEAFNMRLNKSNESNTSSDDVGYLYASFAYDAVWAIALALNATIAEGLDVANFTYDDIALADNLTEAMQKVKFSGVSGDISFDENGERVGHTAIYQYTWCECGVVKCDKSKLLFRRIALNDQNDSTELNITFVNNYTEQCMWRNREGGDVPKDRRTPDFVHLDHGLIYACFTLVPCAVLFLSILLVFNFVTIRKPLIANSGPHMNSVILAGAIVMVIAAISLSFDSNYPHGFQLTDRNAARDRYSAWCKGRLWLLVLGFTFSFGSLFSKIWQIYRLYTNPKLKNQPLSMWNYFIPMALFLFLDFALLISWTVAYPLEWHEKLRISDDGNTEIHFEYCSCDKFGYWIGAVYVYKGLLVVFSLFLAYESRNVKSYFVNDSKHVIMALLCAVLLIGSGAPVSLVLSLFFVPNGAYVVAFLCIVLSSVCSTAILFIPKMIGLYQGKDTFVMGLLPPDETQDENYRSSDGGQQELNSLKKSLHQKQQQDIIQSEGITTMTSDRRGSNNTESDSGVQPDELAYHLNHRKGSV